MRAWVRALGAVAIGLDLSCSPSIPSSPSNGDSNGSANRPVDPCGEGFNLCESRCCPEGTQCDHGQCRYPYSSAHMFVYLCPDFSGVSCDSKFFQIDEMCSPLGSDAIGGTCYDTGLEVAAGQSYAIATCQQCGGNCGRPASFNTPPGFLDSNWYSGFGFFCSQRCDPPSSCGGRSSGSSSGGHGSAGANGGGETGGGTSDGGIMPVPSDAGSDASSAGGPGLCAVSAAGECVECTGFDDPVCGVETCCQLDNLAFCTDLTAAACIGCMSDADCDPGVHCCR